MGYNGVFGRFVFSYFYRLLKPGPVKGVKVNFLNSMKVKSKIFDFK